MVIGIWCFTGGMEIVMRESSFCRTVSGKCNAMIALAGQAAGCSGQLAWLFGIGDGCRLAFFRFGDRPEVNGFGADLFDFFGRPFRSHVRFVGNDF